MLHTAIRLRDVEILEDLFATMTEDGWVIPQWLQDLRKAAEGDVTLLDRILSFWHNMFIN